jgi:hypothetical protein
VADQFLYSQSEALVVLVLLALLLGGAEAGYRLGLRRRLRIDEPAKSRLESVQSEILVLLGILLGFTVAMSVSRYDGRKHAVVSEANAIGTAALRARLLPAPENGEAVTLLRQYVDVRLQSAQQRLDPAPLDGLERKASQLQEKLWLLAAAVNSKQPQNFTTGLFITALNEVIDAKGLRDAALDNHVPASVLVLLFAAAILAVGMVGYANGVANHRAAVVTGMLIVLFALTIFVIVDLDRPRRGLIRVSQISMTELKKGLDKPVP